MQLGLIRRNFFIVIASVLIFLLSFPFPTAILGSTTEQGKLNQLKNQINQNKKKISENNKSKSQLEQEIRNADVKLQEVQKRMDTLQSELDETNAKMSVVQAELDRLQDELIQKEKELDEAIKELHRLNEQLNRRAQDFYKNKDMSYLEVLLSASSFLDFLNKADFLARIVDQDAQLLKDIKRVKADVETAKAGVEANKKTTEEKHAVLLAEARRVQSIQSQEKAERDTLASEMANKQNVISSIGDEQAQALAEVVALERSAAEIERLLNSRPSRGGGTPVIGTPSASGFIWPVNGPVTSTFGPRGGGMHEGIDIGVPTGTPVMASKAGVVSIAGWWGGYGYLVDIDHGGGVHTRYGHNSLLLVSEGQAVSQGQVIAKAGSTGHSTGPHVHFEIRFNGRAVNPLNYLP